MKRRKEGTLKEQQSALSTMIIYSKDRHSFLTRAGGNGHTRHNKKRTP